ELRYTPDVRVRHLVDTTARPSSRIYYTFSRNAVWVALRHLPAHAAAISIARDLALMGVASARAGQLGAYRRGLADAARGRRRAPGGGRAAGGPGGGGPAPPRRRLPARRRLGRGVPARARRHLRERLI